MKVVVTDVSVFFDLYMIQILPEFFGLDMEILTTDIVYNEIIHEEQRNEFMVFERCKQLKVIGFNTEDESEMMGFKTKLKIRSIADRSILYKAIQLKAVLLTCDNKLRKEAESHKIEVRGSIWVIQQLIERNSISKSRGIELLNNLKVTNNRLPFNEINKLIKEWQT